MDDYNNISKAFGCDQTANETACFLSKSKWALLNVSDAYYGNETGKTLPHKEAINNTQWGPVVEGNLLPRPPIQMLREGKVFGGVYICVEILYTIVTSISQRSVEFTPVLHCIAFPTVGQRTISLDGWTSLPAEGLCSPGQQRKRHPADHRPRGQRAHGGSRVRRRGRRRRLLGTPTNSVITPFPNSPIFVGQAEGATQRARREWYRLSRQ